MIITAAANDVGRRVRPTVTHLYEERQLVLGVGNVVENCRAVLVPTKDVVPLFHLERLGD